MAQFGAYGRANGKIQLKDIKFYNKKIPVNAGIFYLKFILI